MLINMKQSFSIGSRNISYQTALFFLRKKHNQTNLSKKDKKRQPLLVLKLFIAITKTFESESAIIDLKVETRRFDNFSRLSCHQEHCMRGKNAVITV